MHRPLLSERSGVEGSFVRMGSTPFEEFAYFRSSTLTCAIKCSDGIDPIVKISNATVTVNND